MRHKYLPAHYEEGRDDAKAWKNPNLPASEPARESYVQGYLRGKLDREEQEHLDALADQQASEEEELRLDAAWVRARRLAEQ